MNQQQETLNKEIEIPGKLIASISRSIGKYLTNYTIYFYRQENGFLAPEIGVTVIFDRRMPYPMVGAIIDTIRKENIRASRKALRTAENLRKLSSALFKYEQARKNNFEEFIEKGEEMRKGIINLIVKTCENV